MNVTDHSVLMEIRDLLKTVASAQEELMKELNMLKEEQKKLQEEVRLNNFVLNGITLRNEIVN